LIVEPVGEVDFVVEEGRIGRRRRDDGHLRDEVSGRKCCRPGQSNKPTVSLSSRRIFILAAAPPEALSPADTILET